MEKMASRSWSCATLDHGVATVEDHYQQLLASGLTEQEMQAELRRLKVAWLSFKRVWLLRLWQPR